MSSRLSRRSGAAFLWDESFLWGIMAYRALKEAGLAFDLIRAADVHDGYLDRYAMLFVPGGWSSNKMKALGGTGVQRIREFVADGGNYLGFCGGAGLASLDGMGLLNIKRRPTTERVPSFSGRIRLRVSEHPAWSEIDDPVFYAWWPPQIVIQDDSIRVLATYKDAFTESFSSDLNVGDVNSCGSWPGLEQLYRINLDPKRLLNDPAVIEGRYGSGRVLLSLVHFDTLDDKDGSQVLKNIWEYLGGQKACYPSSCTQDRIAAVMYSHASISGISVLEFAVSGIIDLGMRNFLWFWRNPMLLQWRRGVRGLEYCSLYVMIQEIAARLGNYPEEKRKHLESNLREISNRLCYFSEKAQRLLVLERLAMQSGLITYERCDDPEIQRLREELFSSSKSYGGLFKEVIDSIDALLYLLVKEEQNK